MATVSSRSHGGLPMPQRIVNPFDSDDDHPTTSTTTVRSQTSNSSSSSAPPSTRYTNPFDDDTKPNGHTKSKSSNPFDSDDSPAKSSKHVAKGNKMKSSSHSTQSSGSHDASNPFSDEYEVTSKPKSRGDSILDYGSLFADEEMASGKPVKERKSSTRAFAAKIAEGGSRIKESASSSLSSVKLPTLSSSSASKGDEKTESKRLGKSKHQQTKELFGEPEPGYISTQNNYFSQSDQMRFQNQTVEQLEQYAVSKSQDTTTSIKKAIRIAEDTKGIATTTLESLHTQGEQIRRTHETTVVVDEELGRGEKLLGSLGGMFSMTWKPKKAHKITGPQAHPDQFKRKNNLGERDSLGLTGGQTAPKPRPQLSGMSSAQAQLEMEKNTQDDAFSDLSNVLGDLKGMTLEMGHEIERQNGDLDRMHDDVHELNARVKGANDRTRRLIGR